MFEDISVRDTSLIAYEGLTSDTLAERYKQIIEALKHLKEANNQMLSEFTGLPINSITGRCLELRRKGIVEEASKKKYLPTMRTTYFWKLKGGVIHDTNS